MPESLHVAYLFSRYPVVSQTFCDSEMLALENRGVTITVGSLNSPPDSFRHERLDQIKADIIYPAPPEIMSAPDEARPEFWSAMKALAAEHEERFGVDTKPLTRARNACYFATQFRRRGVQHVHVHFANRATHTALFLKEAGLTFSFTAHAQDFIVDLANDDLLREMAWQAEFVIAVSDYSRKLLAETCPDAAQKIHRLYNGIALDDFVPRQDSVDRDRATKPLKVISIGRLIEFKGFHILIDAVAKLKQSGVQIELKIIGDGPWRGRLQSQIENLALSDVVTLCGTRSQDQVRALLAESDAFALACLVDASGASDVLPTVIAEAMAAGLPVVSTRVAGVPEMVVHGQTGLLAEPASSEALADALRELVSGKDAWRQQLGTAGSIKARSQFDQMGSAAELQKRFQMSVASEPVKSTGKIDAFVVMSGCSDVLGDRAELSVYVESATVSVIAARLGNSDEAAVQFAQVGALDFFPDGIVLESFWRSRPDWRSLMDDIRREIGTGIDGEEFYLHARRAFWLVDFLEKTDIKRLHAFRSDMVLCVWLVSKLCQHELRLSAVIEPQPSLRRSFLSKVLADFSLVSVADERLASVLKAKDEINLTSVSGTRHRRVGPLKIRQSLPVETFTESVRKWVKRIVQS